MVSFESSSSSEAELEEKSLRWWIEERERRFGYRSLDLINDIDSIDALAGFFFATEIGTAAKKKKECKDFG